MYHLSDCIKQREDKVREISNVLVQPEDDGDVAKDVVDVVFRGCF